MEQGQTDQGCWVEIGRTVTAGFDQTDHRWIIVLQRLSDQSTNGGVGGATIQT